MHLLAFASHTLRCLSQSIAAPALAMRQKSLETTEQTFLLRSEQNYETRKRQHEILSNGPVGCASSYTLDCSWLFHSPKDLEQISSRLRGAELQTDGPVSKS